MPSVHSPAPSRCSTTWACYTHRVAISNNRLVDIDNGQVCFEWKDYRNGNQAQTDDLVRRRVYPEHAAA